MRDQEAPAIGGTVLAFSHDLDAADPQRQIVADNFIMVTGNVHDPHPTLGQRQHRIEHATVSGGPASALVQGPEIDEITHQI